MTHTPASVRWALLAMACVVLSQVVGVRRVERPASSGLQAATSQPAISSPEASEPTPPGAAESPRAARRGACRSSAHEQVPVIASRAGSASVHRVRSAT